MQDFEEIYVSYLKDVYRFLLKLSGNSDVAEELTQATFTIAFENLGKFRGTCKIYVWLCQIAKHEYYAWYRRNKRFVRAEQAGDYPDTEDMEERFLEEQDKMRIYEILCGLPEPYKEVFTLRVMGDMPYRDISRSFGKSESWARVTYYRAKCMIIERMGGEEHAEM